MRRATAFAIALTLSGGLAALAVEDRPLRVEATGVRHEASAVRVEPVVAAVATVLGVPTPTTTIRPTTTTVTTPEPTTTTTAAPEPQPEPEPEPTTTTAVATTVQARPAPPRTTVAPTRGSASSDLLDSLADCESDITASLDTGNGYYGAFQWLPRTWWGLTRPGQPWKDSYEEAMIAEILATPYSEQKAVAARIPLSSWRDQFPGCSRELGLR